MSTSTLPPLSQYSSVFEVHQHLQQVLERATQPISLYPDEVTYKNSAQKKRAFQSPTGDQCNGHTYQQFKHHPMGSNIVKAGLFGTSSMSTIGQTKQERNLHGHAWVAVIIRKPDTFGKTILFWDPDGQEILRNRTTTYNNITSNAQKELVNVYGGRTHLKGVYYGGEGNKGKKDCLPLSMRFLQELMTRGVPENMEALGYVRLA